MTAALKSSGAREDARVLRSRAAMQSALLTLLEDMPLDAITGARIAARAGIGYATFFRHYADVRALLVETVASLTDELAHAMMPALLAKESRRAANALVEAVAQRRALFRSLLAGAGDALRAELSRQVIERVGQLPNFTPEWLPRRLATRVAVTSTVELLDWWLQEAPERSPEDAAELLDRLIISTLSGSTIE